MSKTYMVSYDFEGPTERYQELFDALPGFPAWWHFLDRTWLIATDLDARGLYQQLRPYIDDEANLLIMEVGNDWAGWLPKKALEWIQEHCPRAESKDAIGASS